VQSRRQLLQQALVLPFALPVPASKCCIISEPNCLSQESAEGYRRLLQQNQSSIPGPDLIVVAGAGALARARMPELRGRVLRGAWVIWESEPLSFQSAEAMYVRYNWPCTAMVRSFGRVQPVNCEPAESVADLAGKSVGMKRRMGKGCFVFLGSMLGPHLRAGDHEALELAKALMHVRLSDAV